jgi:hypothetical protein
LHEGNKIGERVIDYENWHHLRQSDLVYLSDLWDRNDVFGRHRNSGSVS